MKFIIIVLIVFSIVKIFSIIWVSKPKPMTPKEIEEYDRKEDQKDSFDF